MQHVTTLINAAMRSRTLRILLMPAMFTGLMVAQDITGTYQMISVHVAYTEVARDSASAADSIATYDVTASWPNLAAATAGSGVTRILKSYAPDDTITTFETPAALMSKAGLAAFELNLNLALTSSALVIPGIENDITTYPTTSTVNCSTGAEIAPVTDNADITLVSTANSFSTDSTTYTWGFGITQSEVFDWFVAPTDWEDATTYGENWGKLTGHFAEDEPIVFDTLEVFWRAIDGPDSDSGIDTYDSLDRHLGIATVPGDTVTIAAMKTLAAAQDPAITINLPTAGVPMIGGKGADSVDDTGDEVDLNNGYLFDPVGDDGIPFNGDEPLMFTGYYFTYNFMKAAGTFKATLEGILAADPTAVHVADSTAVDNALLAIGANAALAAAAAGMVADSVDVWLAAGLPAADAFEKAPVFALGLALTVDASLGTGFDPDDSMHDYIPDSTGRLIFEIDNRCIPTTQTREVSATFVNVASTTGIESDLSTVPDRFVVHANYPNPFNPSTTIAFELPARLTAAVTVWNLLGQQVRTIYSGELMAGRHEVSFDGRDDRGSSLPSGVYFYRVQAGQYNSTRKFMLLK